MTAPPASGKEKARELYEKAVFSTWSGIESRPTPDEAALLSFVDSLIERNARLDLLLTQAINDWQQDATARKSAADALQNQVVSLTERIRLMEPVMIEAADELEAEVKHRYGGDDPHPAYEHKIARDLELPTQLRKLAASTEGSTK